MHQYRWPVPPKYLLKRPDGRWMSMDARVLDLVSRAPHGCTCDNLASACGLLRDEVDVILDKLVASGRIERNRRLTGGRPIERIESPRGDVFWGIAA